MNQGSNLEKRWVKTAILPAYNEEKYIEQTLTALLLQDYPNFEMPFPMPRTDAR